MAISSFLQGAESASDLTTYTFSSQNLGAADSGRYIVVGIGARSTGLLNVSSVTVAGVSATEVIQQRSANNQNVTALYIAAVPTGTSGDVVVTLSAGALRCSISLVRLVTIDSATAVDTASSTASPPSGSMSCGDGGVIIGIALSQTLTTTTWSGITEDYDAQNEAITVTMGRDEFVSAQTGLTVTATFSSSSGETGVWASWDPAAGGSSVLPALDEGMLVGGLQSLSGGLC